MSRRAAAAARARARRGYNDYLIDDEPAMPEVVTVGTSSYESMDPRRLNPFARPHSVVSCPDMLAAAIDLGHEPRYEIVRRANYVQVRDRYNSNVVRTWEIMDDDIAVPFAVQLAKHNNFHCAVKRIIAVGDRSGRTI